MKKPLAVILILLFGFNSWTPGQDKSGVIHSIGSHLTRLPPHLKLKNKGPQIYSITCDYLYLDTLGNLSRKERVTAEYTRVLPDGSARWSNVRISQAKGFDDAFPEGELQKYMEGLTYTLSSPKDMLRKDFFQEFPVNELKTKNLVWDMHMIEQLGWNYFDKLEMNRPYAIHSRPEEVPLAGAGMFQNRRIELTWIGGSKKNEKMCALIQYQAFINKFSVSNLNVNLQGRNHYWGEIWVSLKDKNIEYATLLEDVLAEFTLPGQQNKRLINIFRKATFQKLEIGDRAQR
jgi:hypothetical protein